ncbi:hypothetical protein ABW19_dt0205663 [Dactylella cylindrospora]|nr:hypothetical protein ABW19_dt0205663 [Dactylella cylindrospora]
MVDGRIREGALRRLSFVQPVGFDEPVFDGGELWVYRERTEGFIEAVMELGEGGRAMGLRSVRLDRAIDMVDLERLAYAFPCIEEFEYWAGRPLTPVLSSLGTGNAIAFQNFYRILAREDPGMMSSLIMTSLYQDLNGFIKASEKLREVRIQGKARAEIARVGGELRSVRMILKLAKWQESMDFFPS